MSLLGKLRGTLASWHPSSRAAQGDHRVVALDRTGAQIKRTIVGCKGHGQTPFAGIFRAGAGQIFAAQKEKPETHAARSRQTGARATYQLCLKAFSLQVSVNGARKESTWSIQGGPTPVLPLQISKDGISPGRDPWQSAHMGLIKPWVIKL